MSTTEQRRHAEAFRKMSMVAKAAARLAAGVEALATAAGGAESGQMPAEHVGWFCRALKADALLCLRAADPNESLEELEEMTR